MPPCYSLKYLGRQLLNQHLLIYWFFSLHPSPPRFPHRVYNSCVVAFTSPLLLRPPLSRPRFFARPRFRFRLRYYSRFPRCSCPRFHPMLVHGSPVPVSVPILRSFVRLHSRPLSRYVPFPAPSPSPLQLTSTPPAPFPAPFPPPPPTCALHTRMMASFVVRACTSEPTSPHFK